MKTVVAIDADGVLEGFALVGVPIVPAPDDQAVLDAWRDLDDEVGLAILSKRASRLIGADRTGPTDRLTVVVP